jgi:citrate lyase subunit beta/citryl-CoA lyase
MLKLRRSMMFVPGNNPGMLQNSGIYGADAVIFDLEDAVAINQKDVARRLVANALKYIKYPCETAVRINHISTPFGYDDLDAVLASKPGIIRLPKAESAADIQEVDEIITAAEKRHSYEEGTIKMMAAIETAKGILNAPAIAAASPRMIALAIGGEDFVADLKTTRTKDGKELYAARSMIVFAARAAGIMAIDTVFADINDEATFIAETTMIKELGFDGKSVVNPRQVKLVHQIFTPTVKEIDYARQVLAAYQEALARKSGVISLNGKMIDGPIVDRAERVLAYAAAVGAC